MANTLIDLTNKRFNKLLVLSEVKERGNKGVVFWNCVCDCGEAKIVSGDNLKSEKVKSCGCLRRRSPPNKINLIGVRFNRLIVVEQAVSKSKRTRWKSLCDCGKYTESDYGDLKRGHKQSCGCLQKELASKRITRYGSNNLSYNPNLTPEDRISRRYVLGYSEWSFGVKEKYNFACQKCGDNKGGNLISHHLYSYSKYPKLRLDPENGACLCEDCHIEFHNIYGNKHNTKEQFLEWINNV